MPTSPGQVSGAFDEITVADALSKGLNFDTSGLSTTRKITVVPEPGVGALLGLRWSRPSKLTAF